MVSGEAPRWRLVGRLLPCDAPISHDDAGTHAGTTNERAEARRSRAIRLCRLLRTNAGYWPDAREYLQATDWAQGLHSTYPGIHSHAWRLWSCPPELSRVQDYHQGLIVISGPNGHGKTTTLAALVDLYNETRPAHIITVEDPVEFLHSPKRAVISQREVGVHTRTFRTALKGALREDPDIIAIGELRDRETVGNGVNRIGDRARCVGNDEYAEWCEHD